MSFKITLAGQDISGFVNEKTISIDLALGQGAGNGAGVSGRAATAEFVTSLGPLYSATGAGAHITLPQLVRMGEVIIYDFDASTAVPIFGGYAGKFTDQTDKLNVFTKVECYDYWQHCDRIYINEVIDGLTDIQIINQFCQKYAPWINLSKIPTASAYLFGPKNFRNVSLQKAIQTVCDVTGYQAWISADKVLHYLPPKQSQPAPFALSDQPDFVKSFSYQVTSVEFDDTSAINRVFFYGGKIPSQDFTQDLSVFANGTNTTFPLAYYPRKASDGKMHVNVNNGPDLVLGSATGTSDASNTLKPNGNCDVLINFDAHTLTFAFPPAAGTKVTCKYRYEYPLVVVVPSQPGFQFFGMWLDGSISDDTVFDQTQAVLRCKVLLLEQGDGLRTVHATTWKAGLQAGQMIQIDHTPRNIHDSLIIQEVKISYFAGAGSFKYELVLGAWNWNFVDVMKSAVAFAVPSDSAIAENTVTMVVQQGYEALNAAHSATVGKTQQTGQFYARAVALGDGHDAYPGFTSVSS